MERSPLSTSHLLTSGPAVSGPALLPLTSLSSPDGSFQVIGLLLNPLSLASSRYLHIPQVRTNTLFRPSLPSLTGYSFMSQ